MSAKHHTRRKRRQQRQALKHGRKAKPRHQLAAGRTGGVHHKKTGPASPGRSVTRYRIVVRQGSIIFKTLP
jgi:hypothetical protein